MLANEVCLNFVNNQRHFVVGRPNDGQLTNSSQDKLAGVLIVNSFHINDINFVHELNFET